MDEARDASAAAALADRDFYDTARRRIEQEDHMNVNRLTWLMGSQSFLFSAFAVVINGLVLAQRSPGSSPFEAHQDLLFRMVPMLGLISCVTIYIGVIGGVLALRSLRKMVEQHVAGDSRPPLTGGRKSRWLGLVAPLFLPPAFIVAWMILCWPPG